MINTVYIISWFGENENKEKRKNFHEKQIEWFLNRKMKIVILPQFYKKYDYIHDSNIRYLENQTKLLYCGGARNLLLNEIYSSNEDYVLLADNDCIIESTFSGDSFIEEMNKSPEAYKDITLASAASIPVNVGLDHRKKLKQYTGKHWFIPSIRMHNAFTIFKNIVKFGHKPIYNDSSLRVGEDVDFNIKLVLAGHKTYVFGNIIFKELGGMNAFSTWEQNYKKRQVYYKEHIDIMLKRYNKQGLMMNKNGNPNYKKFLISYGVGEYIIPIGKPLMTNKFF